MFYNLRTAGEATGKDPSTIQRAIKNRKLTAEKDEFGQWKIDPAVLHNLYPRLEDMDVEQRLRVKSKAKERNPELLRELKDLQNKLEVITERDGIKDKLIVQLEGERDRAVKQLDVQTNLLEDRREDKEALRENRDVWKKTAEQRKQKFREAQDRANQAEKKLKQLANRTRWDHFWYFLTGSKSE